ncbi:unnamed protein product [Adineta steineri]|uniref:P-loop containing nucleoside triphosphate hydrolase protein n=1 Tax=Adineta steineri TaxID=433720 RepID=A0A815QJS7_9BILA|nr:unnamed protein product [Adineta steineri]CAF4092933.1 unnamed protein product [Adineta steineri]
MKTDQKNTSSTIKVIGAGFGRTGTTSLKVALNMLGFKCYHMQETGKHPAHNELWIDAYEGKLTDYDLIFKDGKQLKNDPYIATCDWPSTAIWEQLMEKYPDAKVILTMRDAEGWYKSMRNTVYRVPTEFSNSYFLPGAFRRMINMHTKLVWAGTFQNRFEDKDYAINVYNQHNERVKKLVPKEKLLVLDVTKGEGRWKELCEFLEVEEPSENIPFPRVNDTKEMEEKLKKLNRIRWTMMLSGPSVLVAVVACLMYFFLRK